MRQFDASLGRTSRDSGRLRRLGGMRRELQLASPAVCRSSIPVLADLGTVG